MFTMMDQFGPEYSEKLVIWFNVYLSFLNRLNLCNVKKKTISLFFF